MSEEKNIIPASTRFRYLTDEEIKHPDKAISVLFINEIYVENLRYNLLNLIRAAFTRPDMSTTTYGNPEEYAFDQRRCFKLLELAFVLKCSDEDYTLTEDNLLYRKGEGWWGWHLDERGELSYPGVSFRTLLDHEVNNVKLFFDELFSFKSFNDWAMILDDLLSSAHSSEGYDEITDQGYLIIPILTYLEKLVEAIYLVYCINEGAIVFK